MRTTEMPRGKSTQKSDFYMVTFTWFHKTIVPGHVGEYEDNGDATCEHPANKRKPGLQKRPQTLPDMDAMCGRRQAKET
jgi:hypothetical protein